VPLGAVWLNSMPMFHTGGCVLSTLGPIHRQATQVILPAFEAGLVLQVIETERITTTGGVPTMLTALLDHPDFPATDVSSLQSVSSGGAVVPAELVIRIEQRLGVRYATMFGQTEAAPGITMTALSDSAADKASTVGTALPWNEVRVVDPETLQPCAAGQVGELIVRSPMMMSGYYDAPDETAAALIEGGWLRTGDLCTLDERGYVRVAGRLKDMIVRGGENVYPAEIEAVLRRHPAVAEAVVVGLPDSRWGEIVAAAVLLTPSCPTPPSEWELEHWARAELASFKVPRAWRFLEDLPLNAGGKVQKFRVREDWLKKA
jgi:fatty-acyl-CoA synthase